MDCSLPGSSVHGILQAIVLEWIAISFLPANAGATGDMGSIPGWGRFPGEGSGNLLWCSYLENPMDRGAGWGYGPWGPKESDMTEHTHTQLFNENGFDIL